MSDKSEKPKRKRRRRGGLRVPSDKVPRTKSNPEIAVPESEDPHLAMSVAYAFGPSTGPVETPEVEEEDVKETLRSATTEHIEEPSSAGEFAPVKTIELDSVEEIGDIESYDSLEGEATEAAADHPLEHDESDSKTQANEPPEVDELRSTIRVIKVGDDEERTVVSELPLAEGGPLDPVADVEPQSESVDIAFDDVTPLPVSVDAPAGRYNRARTVALSDADLEELMDEHSGSNSNPVVRIEPRSRSGIPEPRDASESGEIIADDMIEEIDDGAIAKPVEILESVESDQEAPTEAPDETADPEPAADRERKRADNSEPPPPPPTSKVRFKKTPPAAPVGKPKPPPAPAKPAAAKPPAVAAAAPRRGPKGKPWFEEIFDENYLRTLPFLTPHATEAESDFVLAALGLEPGAQILDVGCGYGRHSMELAARGYHVVGLDTSLPLLLRGADEAQRRGLNINFVHGDMREMQFDAQFDGAFCLFETFGYFDDETNKATAKNIAKALKPGAKVVLDVLNRDYLIRELPTRVWWEGDGCVVLEEVDFNFFSSRITSKRSIAFEDGRQLEQEISIRAFVLHELGKVLHAAGFRVVEVSGSIYTRGRFFGAHSRDIIVVAEKRKS